MGPRDKRLKESRVQEDTERGGEVPGTVGEQQWAEVEKTCLGEIPYSLACLSQWCLKFQSYVIVSSELGCNLAPCSQIFGKHTLTLCWWCCGGNKGMGVWLTHVSSAHQELLQPEVREAWCFHPGVSGNQENGERQVGQMWAPRESWRFWGWSKWKWSETYHLKSKGKSQYTEFSLTPQLILRCLGRHQPSSWFKPNMVQTHNKNASWMFPGKMGGLLFPESFHSIKKSNPIILSLFLCCSEISLPVTSSHQF